MNQLIANIVKSTINTVSQTPVCVPFKQPQIAVWAQARHFALTLPLLASLIAAISILAR